MLAPSARAGRLRPPDSQTNRSRYSIWSTWWPAATVFPAGAARASIPPTAESLSGIHRSRARRTGWSATESIIASRRCRLWMAFSFPTAAVVRVQVDSAGHLFRLSSQRPANQTPSYVWAGGVIPTEPPDTTATKLGRDQLCFARPCLAVVARQQGHHFQSGGDPASKPRLQAVAFPRHGGQHGDRFRHGCGSVCRPLGVGRWSSAISATGDQRLQRRIFDCDSASARKTVS